MKPFTTRTQTSNRNTNKTEPKRYHTVSRRSALKLGTGAIASMLAGCIESEEDSQTDSNEDEGDGGADREPVLIDAHSSESQVHDGWNRHVANVSTTLAIYRAQGKVNGKYVYFAECGMTCVPVHGSTYKSDLRKGTVRLDVRGDDIKLVDISPDRNESYEVNEREKSESFGLQVSVAGTGGGVNYGSKFELTSGKVLTTDFDPGSRGSHDVSWIAPSGSTVHNPISFSSLGALRSENKFEAAEGPNRAYLWTLESEVKAHAVDPL